MMLTKLRNIVKTNVSNMVDSAEVSLRPEVIAVNSLASSLAYLVMSDGVAEEQELVDVGDFLIDQEFVVQNNLIREVAEKFLSQVDRMEKGFEQGGIEGQVVIGEVIADIALIKGDKKHVPMISDTIKLVTSGGSADKDEIKARTRILKAIGAE